MDARLLYNGNDAAPALLENLALRHGFISYELLRGQYHIHNAFKVYLQRLGAELPDTERRRLCRRSGQWYELQNDFLTAFCYYHTAGDYDKMLTVFEKDRGCSFENNYKNKIMAYFGEAPETIRQKHIKAGLIYALWLFLSGENERLQQEIRKLRKYIGQLEDRQEREQCLGELEFLLGETQYNDVEAMALILKSRCSCCGSRYAFSRRRLSGARCQFDFVYVLPSGRYAAENPGCFSAGYGILLPSGAESRCRF